VFHGFLVVLVGLKLVTVRHLVKVLQMRLHLHGTSCHDHADAHILTPVAPFHRLAILLDSLVGGIHMCKSSIYLSFYRLIINNNLSSLVGGSRFGFWRKKTIKFDVNRSLMQELFEYVDFL
jgi:hypothetical protein